MQNVKEQKKTVINSVYFPASERKKENNHDCLVVVQSL